MKALITGSEGFVGTHFTTFLKNKGWEVYGLDTKSYADEDVVQYCLNNTDEWFDLVVHCAYEVGGRAHIDGTNMALAHNLMMDAAMFDWALKSRQGAVLYFSSSAAYPIQYQSEDTAVLLSEDLTDICDANPDSNYGWAKLSGERMAKQFSENGGRVHVVRPFSGYSGSQSLDYPFPSIVKRVSEGDMSVWGPKGQSRDWIHISDVVAGAFQVYEQDVREPINLCTGVATEMGELAHYVNYILHGSEDTHEVTYLPDKPTGVFYRVGDPTKFFNIYTPLVTLEEGINEALEIQGVFNGD